MTKKKKAKAKRPIETYEHRDKQRVDNPPVGLVTPDTDPDAGTKKTYAYDPHLDPQLQWAGKAEHTSFEVPTVSLHVHERIDPRTIIEAVKRKGEGGEEQQMTLFDTERDEPLRHAIEFYRHAHGWSNRLIAGDSLLVMNSLLEKEGMAGKVQVVYFDPPYGIRYGSNFQPFVNRREVKDGSDEDLTAEPEQIRAFRDTWELGIHSYLTYLRDRVLLARELLAESGSLFVQISSENLHHVREILDEVFGAHCIVEIISFRKKTMPLGGRLLEGICDYLVWYAKDKEKVKYRPLFVNSQIEGDSHWNVAITGESTRRMTKQEVQNHANLPPDTDVGQLISLYPAGSFQTGLYTYELNGNEYRPAAGRSWKTPIEGMKRLDLAGRLVPYSGGKTLRYLLKHSDYPVSPISNMWNDTSAPPGMRYAVETSPKVVQRCILMSSDPGDLVFDPTCGSGTTAFVAETWGRRWVSCDTSRVALTLAKQRLMAASFDYFNLAHPEEGVGSGFVYKTVPHITLKSIANNPAIKEGMTHEQIEAAIARHAPQETLYDQPQTDSKRTRVSGPFTVEAVPAPAVKSVDELLNGETHPADASIARSGETLRQDEWREELMRAGIRGKAGQRFHFARLEPLPGCRWLHADGETRPSNGGANSVREGGTANVPQRIVVAFGPEHAPLEQRQVANAIEEAQALVPKPKIIVFAAFQFDPEAAKDIDETNWPGVTLLKAQMNADLLTEDLKKKRASNESFWLIGQPDVQVEHIAKGTDKGKLRVSVHGFDYYNTKTGGIESGGEEKIAVWLLDTDYDGRSLFPRQVFFPMAGANEGWARLAKNLKAEIDEDLIGAYRGTVSLPFEAGEHRRIAVKIVDDRGIESLKVIGID